MKLRERVANLRRKLPQGAAVENYAFVEGPADLNAPYVGTWRGISFSL